MRTSAFSLLSACQHLVLELNESSRDSTAGIVKSLVISRLAGMLLTPAAGVDFCGHAIATPLAVLYSAGRSVVHWKLDFSLPREHLQRVSQSVAPFFLAGPMSLIHPYAGIFFSESANKHFMWGILLSGSEQIIPVVCSPITSMRETQAILSSIKPSNFANEKEASKESIDLCKRIVGSALNWEYSLEVLQSVDFFDLKLASKVSQRIVCAIDDSEKLSDVLKFLARRASVVAFIALGALDYIVQTAASVLCLAVGAVIVIGGDPPIYFEACSSPLLHLTNFVKVILYPLGLMLGALVYLVKPEYGREMGAVSSRSFGLLPVQLRMLELRLAMQLWLLPENHFIVLPIVDQHGGDSEDGLSFLPSQRSHMMYLLIQRTKQGFHLEMVERGGWKGSRRLTSITEVLAICHDALSLRFHLFRTHALAQKVKERTFTESATVNLPAQKNVTNCVVTNLAATMSVANQLAGFGIGARDELGKLAKTAAERRHGFMSRDFYPFAAAEDLKKCRPEGGIFNSSVILNPEV